MNVALSILLAWLCPEAWAQTRVHPEQIRSWRQVSPNQLVGEQSPFARPGLQLNQTWIPNDWVEAWSKVPAYDRYRVAVTSRQPDRPILITCMFGFNGLGGASEGCDVSWPLWFGKPLPEQRR